MSDQLALGLPPRHDFSAASFVDGEANAAARWALSGWRAWPARMLALYGPPGCGKSHLTAMWAAESGAQIIAGADLGAKLDALNEDGPIAIEDADGDCDEDALFHLINRANQNALPALLITGQLPPARWNVDTPDLKSRLNAMPTAELSEPDDELLRKMLEKLFADRQSPLVDGIIAYLLPRMDRSVDGARNLVEALDRDALARRTTINRNVARRVLEQMDSEEEQE